MGDRKIMYVCTDCAENNPEGCGHYDPKDLAVMPDGAWLCEMCAEELDILSDHGVTPRGAVEDAEWPTFGEFPKPPEYAPATTHEEEPTMKHLTLILPIIALTACGNGAELQGGDYADAATTAGVLATGSELNPLLAGANPVVGTVALLGAKQVGKAALIDSGYEPEFANEAVSAAGYGAACWNLVYLAGGPTPAGAAAALMCGAATWPESDGIQCSADGQSCWDAKYVCEADRCQNRETGEIIR